MLRNNKRFRYMFLIYFCLFAVSMFYRFYDLDRRSFFSGSDAPGYAGVVRTYRAGLDYIVRAKILGQNIGSANDYLYENGGQFGTAGKDGIISLGLIGSIIFGNNTSTFLYTSAIFGVFTVLLLFFMLSRANNLFYAFLVSLLFAVSPYHIGFSREGLTVIFSSFFLLAGIYSYIRFMESNGFKYLFLCGLSLGSGFSCHYNIAPFIFVFFAYEAGHLFLKRDNLKRILILSVSAFLPLLLTEFFTLAIKLYGTWQHISMIDKFNPYFNGLFLQLMDVVQGGINIQEGPFYYFKSFLYHEGIIPSILLILAVLFIIRRGPKVDFGIGYFLISMFLLPFIYFFKLQHVMQSRAILSYIPLCYLVIGYGLSNFVRFKKLFSLIILIAIIVSGFRSLDYFNYRSNFEQAVKYMELNKGVRHITSVWSLSRLYVGRQNAVYHAELPYAGRLTKLRYITYQVNPVPVDKFKSLYNDGYNYLVLNIPPSVSNDLTEAAMAIQPEYSTDTMACNDRGDSYCDPYDPALLRDKKGKYLYHFNVYDLGKVINKLDKDDIEVKKR